MSPDSVSQPGVDLADAAAPAPSQGGVARRPAPPAEHASDCLNCGLPVGGRFCANCGQRLDHAPLTIGHFLREASEDLTHADSRVWRTLAALLFKPGFLTREFFDGRRARYLPPVRLYLVVSVVFFAWASVTGHEPVLMKIDSGRSMPTGAVSFVPLHEETRALAGPAKPGETHAQQAARDCGSMDYDGPWSSTLLPALRAACLRAAQDNGRTVIEGLLHNLPRALFVFLPLMAGLMSLMYWRPARYYIEHLLLLVHNHAFVFLAITLYSLASTVLPHALKTPVAWLLVLYVAYYMYAALRRVYGQGRYLTLTKLTVLGGAYLVSAATMFAGTFLYTFLTA